MHHLQSRSHVPGGGGGLLHGDTFAHNKSDNAYKGKSRYTYAR
jgi:hypothetical protein